MFPNCQRSSKSSVHGITRSVCMRLLPIILLRSDTPILLNLPYYHQVHPSRSSKDALHPWHTSKQRSAHILTTCKAQVSADTDLDMKPSPSFKQPIIINSRITIAVNCNVTRRSNKYAHYAYEADSPTPIEVSLPHKRRVDPRCNVYPHREENFDLKSYYIIGRRRDQPYAHARIKLIVMVIGQRCGL